MVLFYCSQSGINFAGSPGRSLVSLHNTFQRGISWNVELNQTLTSIPLLESPALNITSFPNASLCLGVLIIFKKCL